MLEFKLSNYRRSISQFRLATGIGTHASVEESVEVDCGSCHFRYRTSDVYLTDTKPASSSDWSKVATHSYTQMKIPDELAIGGGKFSAAFSQPDPRKVDLALVVIATSEAVRSKVVYQMIQQMLGKAHMKFTWAQLRPLLVGTWAFNTKENHKKRPMKYGALSVRDYYNPQAKKVIADLRAAGFILN